MTKTQYMNLMAYHGGIRTAEQAHANGFATLKEAKQAKQEIIAKREERSQLKINTNKPVTNRVTGYVHRKGYEIFDHMRTSINSTFDCRFSNDRELHISVHTYDDWNGYAKSYGKPMKKYNYTIEIPIGGVISCRTIDGITTVLTKKRIVFGNTFYEGYIVTVGKSLEDVRITKTFVAENNIGVTAHGNTVHNAIVSLERKIKAVNHKNEIRKNLTLDTIISPKDYMEITGACQEGTREFMDEMGYSHSVRMKVSDVLEVTKGRYGHERLLKAVEHN